MVWKMISGRCLKRALRPATWSWGSRAPVTTTTTSTAARIPRITSMIFMETILSGVDSAQAAGFRQKSHAMHEVLQSDNTNQSLVFHDRNQGGAARTDLTESGSQRLAFVSDVVGLAHGRLHITVAFGPQRI